MQQRAATCCGQPPWGQVILTLGDVEKWVTYRLGHQLAPALSNVQRFSGAGINPSTLALSLLRRPPASAC